MQNPLVNVIELNGYLIGVADFNVSQFPAMQIVSVVAVPSTEPDAQDFVFAKAVLLRRQANQRKFLATFLKAEAKCSCFPGLIPEPCLKFAEDLYRELVDLKVNGLYFLRQQLTVSKFHLKWEGESLVRPEIRPYSHFTPEEIESQMEIEDLIQNNLVKKTELTNEMYYRQGHDFGENNSGEFPLTM